VGGTWHVEGQLVRFPHLRNERYLTSIVFLRICATALYYYSSANITVCLQSEYKTHGVDYLQDRHDWLPEVFGCEQHEPAVKYVGDVDSAKPGHRKILALGCSL